MGRSLEFMLLYRLISHLRISESVLEERAKTFVYLVRNYIEIILIYVRSC